MRLIKGWICLLLVVGYYDGNEGEGEWRKDADDSFAPPPLGSLSWGILCDPPSLGFKISKKCRTRGQPQDSNNNNFSTTTRTYSGLERSNMNGSLCCSVFFPTIFLRLLLLFVVCFATTVCAQECTTDGVCDTHLLCPLWKKEGKCKKDAELMQKHCPASCYAPVPVTQTAEELVTQTSQFGVQQEATGDKKEQTMEIIVQSTEYMKKLSEEMIRVTKCSNKHEYCSFWAADGTSCKCWEFGTRTVLRH